VLFLPYTTFICRVYAIDVVTGNLIDIAKNICLVVEFTKYCIIKFDIQIYSYISNNTGYDNQLYNCNV